MPKRKRTSYATRRVKRRRLNRRRRRVPRVTRQLGTAFSSSQLVKLRYVDRFTINPALGTFALHNFRANSIYDPDVTSTGHQPMGYDQWANFYDHYVVIGSQIKVTFVSPGGAITTDAALVGVHLDDDLGAFATSTTEIMEQAKAKYRFLTPSNSAAKVVMRHGFSCKKFFNLRDVRDNTERIGAQFGTDPSEQAYFRVFIGPIGTSQDIAGVNCIVELNYICMLSERKDLLQS